MALTAAITKFAGDNEVVGFCPIIVHATDSTLGEGDWKDHSFHWRLKTCPEGFDRSRLTDHRPVSEADIDYFGIGDGAWYLGGDIDSKTWGFMPTHAGSYVIELRVIDADHNEDTAEATVTIAAESTVTIQEYHVDPDDGNDTTGDGSEGTPWETPQKAVDAVEANMAANPAHYHKIILKSGSTAWHGLIAGTIERTIITTSGAGAADLGATDSAAAGLIDLTEPDRVVIDNIDLRDRSTSADTDGIRITGNATDGIDRVALTNIRTDDNASANHRFGVNFRNGEASGVLVWNVNIRSVTDQQNFMGDFDGLVAVGIQTQGSANEPNFRFGGTVATTRFLVTCSHFVNAVGTVKDVRLPGQFGDCLFNYFEAQLTLAPSNTGGTPLSKDVKVSRNYHGEAAAANSWIALASNGDGIAIDTSIFVPSTLSKAINFESNTDQDGLIDMVLRYNTFACLGTGDMIDGLTAAEVSDWSLRGNLFVRESAPANNVRWIDAQDNPSGLTESTLNLFMAAGLATNNVFRLGGDVSGTISYDASEWEALDEVTDDDFGTVDRAALAAADWRPAAESDAATGGGATPYGVHRDYFGHPMSGQRGAVAATFTPEEEPEAAGGDSGSGRIQRINRINRISRVGTAA